MPETADNPRVYLCYSREDFPEVERWYHALESQGFQPWMEDLDLVPGEVRKSVVEDAVATADFFIVCVSRRTGGERGRVQQEISQALDTLQSYLENDIYLIPALLEECALPERLKEFHPVRLYRPDGFERLLHALRTGVERRRREHRQEPMLAPPPSNDQDSAPRIPSETDLYRLLGLAYRGWTEDRPARTAACIQQALLLLFRLCYRDHHGDAAAASVEGDALLEFIRTRFATEDPRLLRLVQNIGRACRMAAHDLDENSGRKHAGNLLTAFTAAFFFVHRRIRGRTDPDREQLFRAFSPPETDTPEDHFVFPKAKFHLPTESPDRSGEPAERRTVALHQAAIDNPAAQQLSPHQKVLVNVACFQMRSGLEIPFIQSEVRNEDVEIEFLTVLASVTVVAAKLATAHTVVYIGPELSADAWGRRYRLTTNGRDQLDVFEIAQEDLPDDQSTAPESREILHHDIDGETFANYRHTCKERTGFSQSNIVLLNDDHDLLQALSYPFDVWRLFLHPRQLQVVEHPARFLFVQGGPGTGKTVVLAHRMMRIVERREHEGDANFKIIFLSFTASVAENMRRMLDKLGVNLDRIVIADVQAFFVRKSRKELVLNWDRRRRQIILHEELRFPGKNAPGQGRRYVDYIVTDVFFDEFQDFPTKDEDNYIIKMIRAVKASRATLTCTYDEHQSIYHTETDLKYWDRLLANIEHVRLDYCYRMAREISEISSKHRRIMLAHARDMLALSGGDPPGYSEQPAQLAYAFTGGTVSLVPTVGLRQITVAKRIVSTLREELARDTDNRAPRPVLTAGTSDVVIIFFNPADYGRQYAGKLSEGWYDNLKRELNVEIFNPFAVKGLEFRAGVVLFPQYCFMKYRQYLRDGVDLRRLDEFCAAILDYHERHVHAITDAGFRKSTVDYFHDLLFFLTSRPSLSQRREGEGLRELTGVLQNAGISGNDLGVVHELYQRYLSHELKSLLVRYDLPSRESPTAPPFDRPMYQKLRALIAAETAKVRRHTRLRRSKLIHGEIDRSLRDLNEFYVALTRFRERTFLVYDQEYDLAPVMPGAEVLDETELL